MNVIGIIMKDTQANPAVEISFVSKIID